MQGRDQMQGRFQMQGRLRLAGQAVQPLLLMFPLGLFAMALFFDAASLLGAPHLVGTLAFWNILAGLIGGAIAALAGGYEAVSARDPAGARIAFLSLLIDVGVLILFAVLTLMRVRSPDRVIDAGLLAVELFGLGLAVFGAWYGGRFGSPRSPTNRPRAPISRRQTPAQAPRSPAAGPQRHPQRPPQRHSQYQAQHRRTVHQG